jgi:hypothetical protein
MKSTMITEDQLDAIWQAIGELDDEIGEPKRTPADPDTLSESEAADVYVYPQGDYHGPFYLEQIVHPEVLADAWIVLHALREQLDRSATPTPEDD